jgi:hypothetical protein
MEGVDVERQSRARRIAPRAYRSAPDNDFCRGDTVDRDIAADEPQR